MLAKGYIQLTTEIKFLEFPLIQFIVALDTTFSEILILDVTTFHTEITIKPP